MKKLILIVLITLIGCCRNNGSYFYNIKCYDNGNIILDENVKNVIRYSSDSTTFYVNRFNGSWFEITSSMKCIFSEQKKNTTLDE